MQRIAPLISTGASAQEARDTLASSPDLAAYLAGLSRSSRSTIRAKLMKAYDQAVVEVLLPLKPTGGPRRVKYTGPWELLSGPGREVVAEAIGMPRLEDSAASDWDAKKVSAAADALVAYYLAGSPTSAAMALRALRAGLAAIGVTAEISAASARSEITALHNARIAEMREERVAAGIDTPKPYARLEDLVDRVKAFIANPGSLSPMTAADFLVAMSARPGEAETLTLGDRGAVKGALKKRSPEKQYNLVSALGSDLAETFIAKWRAADSQKRRAAVLGLTPLVHGWGIQKRDLRAVGAALAVKAEILAGRATNAGQQRRVHAAALRHEPAPRAQDHYERVNDPLAQLCAQLSELSVSQLEAVKGLVATLRP